MAQKTFNTDNVRETASKFSTQSQAFEDSLRQLTTTIQNYISENHNDAGDSVRSEWEAAQPNMQKVKEYLEKFREGLNKQAEALDQTEQSLKWK